MRFGTGRPGSLYVELEYSERILSEVLCTFLTYIVRGFDLETMRKLLHFSHGANEGRKRWCCAILRDSLGSE